MGRVSFARIAPLPSMSYRIFFLAVMLATIPAFVITRLVPFTYDDKPNDK